MVCHQTIRATNPAGLLNHIGEYAHSALSSSYWLALSDDVDQYYIAVPDRDTDTITAVVRNRNAMLVHSRNTLLL